MHDRVNEARNLASAIVTLALDNASDVAVALSALGMAYSAAARGAGMSLEQFSAAADKTAEIIYKQPNPLSIN
jgi:hypothetical protein